MQYVRIVRNRIELNRVHSQEMKINIQVKCILFFDYYQKLEQMCIVSQSMDAPPLSISFFPLSRMALCWNGTQSVHKVAVQHTCFVSLYKFES